MNFIDCSFKKKKDGRKINETLFNKARFFYSEREGPVHFKNTTMVLKVVGTQTYAFSVFEISIGGFVIMDENSTILCNRGFYLELENNTHFIYTEKNKSDCRKNVTFLKYSCKLCGPLDITACLKEFHVVSMLHPRFTVSVVHLEPIVFRGTSLPNQISGDIGLLTTHHP